MSPKRPIIIVTGANSGVGFGICHRLLEQLAQHTPSDAKPQFVPLDQESHSSEQTNTKPYDGLTLILACRDEKRALAARQRLLNILDNIVEKEHRQEGCDGQAERFRRGVNIRFHAVDMADMRSVFRFGDEVSQMYPYVSHLICNAGGGTFTGINFFYFIWQVIRNPVMGVSVTESKIQRAGVISPDGLGLVWQTNLFSHYVLSRYLEPLFASYRSKTTEPARVIWMSSLEASPTTFNRDDWQCIKTSMAYEASKYQIDLMSHELHLRTLHAPQPAVIRHILVHPGVSHSEFTKALIISALEYVKLVLLYVARLLGSMNHVIKPTSAAIAAVHLSLVALLYIPDKLTTFTHTRSIQTTKQPPPTLYENSLYTHQLYRTGMRSAEAHARAEANGVLTPMKFSSETDICGRPRVGAYAVIDYSEHVEDGTFLLDKCETLYQAYLKLEGGVKPPKST